MKFLAYLTILSSFILASCSSGSGSGASDDGAIVVKHSNGVIKARYSIEEDEVGNFKADGAIKEWHESGMPKAEGSFDMGKKTGVWKAWDSDGLLSKSVEFEKDKKSGTFKEYQDGELSVEGNYANDLKQGEWRYYEDGEVTIVHRYDSDKKVTLKDTRWRTEDGITFSFADGKYEILGKNIEGKYEFDDEDEMKFYQGDYRSKDYDIVSLKDEALMLERSRRGGLLNMQEITLTKVE